MRQVTGTALCNKPCMHNCGTHSDNEVLCDVSGTPTMTGRPHDKGCRHYEPAIMMTTASLLRQAHQRGIDAYSKI